MTLRVKSIQGKNKQFLVAVGLLPELDLLQTDSIT